MRTCANVSLQDCSWLRLQFSLPAMLEVEESGEAQNPAVMNCVAIRQYLIFALLATAQKAPNAFTDY